MQLPSAFWHVDEVVVARTRISLQRICHYDVITALGLLFRRIVINAGVQPQRAFLLVTFEFISLCLPASDDHMSLFDRVSNVTRYPSMLLARARKSYLGKMRPLGQNGLPYLPCPICRRKNSVETDSNEAYDDPKMWMCAAGGVLIFRYAQFRWSLSCTFPEHGRTFPLMTSFCETSRFVFASRAYLSLHWDARF